MARNSFTILSLSQAKALENGIADETAKKDYAKFLQQILSEYKEKESANRMGGRKPSKLWFVGEPRIMPIFQTGSDGKPIIPSTEEEWSKVRATYVYPYSTSKDGSETGYFFGGQLFKIAEIDGVPVSGIGGLNQVLQEWENSVERLGLSNEQAAKATQEKLKAAGEIACDTVVVGVNRNGGDRYGYNLSKAE